MDVDATLGQVGPGLGVGWRPRATIRRAVYAVSFMDVLGIDVCAGSWLGVLSVDGRFVEARLSDTVEGLLNDYSPDVAAIDIPIGLVGTGWRACDLEARERLGKRRSSVFPIPPRAVVEAPTYDDANERCRAINGKGLSKQAFAIFPTILEVDALIGGKTRIVEVHPEVSFVTLAGAPLSKKKSWGGMKRRIELLDRVGFVIPHDLGGASEAPPDDVLDATVAAWSGARFLKGEAVRVGSDDGQRREDGEPIAIWA